MQKLLVYTHVINKEERALVHARNYVYGHYVRIPLENRDD
jgi:hypothetical protein